MHDLRVAVIGAGLMGRRRSRAAAACRETDLAVVVDSDRGRAQSVAAEFGCIAGTDWREAVGRDDIDIVVVSTPNNLLAEVGTEALRSGKHVLIEKPMAVRVEDAESMVEEARRLGRKLKVGCNLRNHPAVAEAREILVSGAIGEPMFLRGCYGHGGRPGYEKEWRCDPERSGGGELVDQGVHLIDIARWFFGDFEEVSGFVTRAFWEIAPLEDNVFALLRTADGKVASLHASWTHWKNRFQLEVFGRKGYLVIDGLGGSYGPERLIFGVRDPRNPPPREETFEFDGVDVSWAEEWEGFVRCIRDDSEPLSSGYEGLQALRVIRAIYASAESGRVVGVDYP